MPDPLRQITSLNEQQWLELMHAGEILETSSNLGPKVSAQPNGEFIKILRVKNSFSTYGVINPAKRFVRNARKLATRGIPTVKVREIYHLDHLACWAVRYQGLEGTTLRDMIKQDRLDENLLNQLVSFIAHLHDEGVYFRALHMGNIVLTPQGELGLIDILDCHFRPRLFNYQRKRNFRHMFRYNEAQPFESRIIRMYRDLIQHK